jgi:hypothetical protein
MEILVVASVLGVISAVAAMLAIWLALARGFEGSLAVGSGTGKRHECLP